MQWQHTVFLFTVLKVGNFVLLHWRKQLTVSSTAVQTAAIAAGSYVYDLEITSAGSIKTRLVQGKITVSPEVTR